MRPGLSRRLAQLAEDLAQLAKELGQHPNAEDNLPDTSQAKPDLTYQLEDSPLDYLEQMPVEPIPRKVCSLSAYLKCITDLYEAPAPAGEKPRFYYRGQYSGLERNKTPGTDDGSESKWTLTPSLARIMHPKTEGEENIKGLLQRSCGENDGKAIQSILLQRFRRLAEQHYHSVALSTSKEFEFITWLSIAQHHKVPTYLMDWSVNPLVGLYFAIDDAFADDCPKQDGDVWVFDLVRLRKRPDDYLKCFLHEDDIDFDVPAYASIGVQREVEKVTRKDLIAGKQLKRPIIIVPRLTARRIDAQAARFVYWDAERGNHLAAYSDGANVRPWRRLKKLCWIPAEHKRAIADQLAAYRIHPGTIDADLDGYGRFLRWGGL